MKTGFDKSTNTFVTDTGQTLTHIHPYTPDCDKFGCCIHSPTIELPEGWRTHWRDDTAMMEVVCPHNTGHPHPDYLNFVERKYGKAQRKLESIHGCDGCCTCLTTKKETV